MLNGVFVKTIKFNGQRSGKIRMIKPICDMLKTLKNVKITYGVNENTITKR